MYIRLQFNYYSLYNLLFNVNTKGLCGIKKVSGTSTYPCHFSFYIYLIYKTKSDMNIFIFSIFILPNTQNHACLSIYLLSPQHFHVILRLERNEKLLSHGNFFFPFPFSINENIQSVLKESFACYEVYGFYTRLIKYCFKMAYT